MLFQKKFYGVNIINIFSINKNSSKTTLRLEASAPNEVKVETYMGQHV